MACASRQACREAHGLGCHALTAGRRVVNYHWPPDVLIIAVLHVGKARLIGEPRAHMRRHRATALCGCRVPEPEGLVPHVELREPPVVWRDGREELAGEVEAVVRPALISCFYLIHIDDCRDERDLWDCYWSRYRTSARKLHKTSTFTAASTREMWKVW